VSVSEWREVRIGDIGDVVTGKTPSSKNPEYFGDEIPFVTPTDYKNYHKNIYSSERYLSQAGKEVLGNKLLPINSVIVTCIGSDMGKVAINKVECITNQQINSIILKRDLADSDFIYYTLISMQEYLKMLARGGTTMPIVNKSTFEEIKLLLPPFPEQKAIAATLSALDDMIELNNQINKTLEEMAQAIFKSWFVDFEPFKNGEFEESELGLIPKGWRVGVLGDIIDIFDSKRVPLSNRQRSVMEKKYPYYGAATLMDYVDNYIFDGVYVLLGEDGTVMDEKGYPILQYVWGKFWVNNHAHVLKGKGVFSDEYLYILLKNTNVASIVTGAVQLKINQNNLTGLKIMIPPEDVVKQYNDVVKDIFACFRSNADEIKILISLRDTLLPKLISGEIRVPVEEVV
jgi:type I restriction enzyme S subunit